MKPRYSLRIFLIGTVVLGLITASVIQYLSRVVPVELNTILFGELKDDPSTPVEEPTLDEVRHLISAERRNPKLDFSGWVEKLKVEAVTTTIDPPRFVPLIGNACPVRAIFRCSVTVVHSDGSTSRKVVLVKKNVFRLISNGRL